MEGKLLTDGSLSFVNPVESFEVEYAGSSTREGISNLPLLHIGRVNLAGVLNLDFQGTNSSFNRTIVGTRGSSLMFLLRPAGHYRVLLNGELLCISDRVKAEFDMADSELFIAALQECPPILGLHTAEIVGGIIGGLAGLALIIIIIVCCCRKLQSGELSAAPVVPWTSQASLHGDDEARMFAHRADSSSSSSSSSSLSNVVVPFPGAQPQPGTPGISKRKPVAQTSARPGKKELDSGLGKDGFPLQEIPDKNTNT
jgi:hypothetical protein